MHQVSSIMLILRTILKNNATFLMLMASIYMRNVKTMHAVISHLIVNAILIYFEHKPHY